jgi:hypothetical protein
VVHRMVRWVYVKYGEQYGTMYLSVWLDDHTSGPINRALVIEH